MKTIEWIGKRLQEELPGYSAQRRAVPGYRDEGPVDFDSLKNPRLSGVLILLYPGDDGAWYFPLMKRQEYSGTHSGQVSLPGGRFEPEDITLHHTALRETEEEIGISREKIRVLGELTRIFIPPSNYLVKPVVGFVEHTPEFRADPREVQDLFSVRISDLLDDRLFRTTDLMVRQTAVKDIPYYAFNDEIVWGATAMILSEFRQVLLETDF